MQENQDTQDVAANEAAETQSDTNTSAPKRPALKRNGLKEDFKKKGEELDKENKPPMSREETLKFYEENLPFMKMQDEFEELRYRFEERRIKNIELQVREVQAIGYLAEWKAGQDEARKRQEQEEKMKAEWDAMSDEEKEQWKAKAKANLRVMELQAKGHIQYDGTNAADVLSFVTGELPEGEVTVDSEDKRFCFQIPDLHTQGAFNEICMLPEQTLTRTEAGEFIVS